MGLSLKEQADGVASVEARRLEAKEVDIKKAADEVHGVKFAYGTSMVVASVVEH